MRKKAKCEGRDRFITPSVLLSLLEADLLAATEAFDNAKREFIAAARACDVLCGTDARPLLRRNAEVPLRILQAREIYQVAWWKKYNLERRLANIRENPRRDTPGAFERLLIVGVTETSCVLWDELLNESGYGVAYVEGRMHLAHRVSYARSNDIPMADIKGIVIRHKCDNPKCINPFHLEPGTQADNVRDMHERGRNGHGGPAGSRNASAKLRESDIPLIRKRLARGEKAASIAKDYCISDTAVSRIKLGKNWCHTNQQGE